MAIGISIALIIVFVVGAVVFYFTRKTGGGMTSTGHRTLTSFENPVYEYEQSTLNAKQ